MQTHTTRRKLPNLIRGHAGIVNILHVQMSIRVNSQPNPYEHINSFFLSQKTALVQASSVDPHEMTHHVALCLGLHCLAKCIWGLTWDFKKSGILKSVDSDEPVQPPFKGRNSKWCSVSSTHRIFMRLTNTQIRLSVCAGWSEPMLVPHTTLLEISCHGSII